MNNSYLSAFSVMAMVVVASVGPAWAGDSLHRNQLAEKSSNQALTGASSSVLARKAGPGTVAVVSSLGRSLGTSRRMLVGWSTYKTDTDSSTSFLTGNGWTLTVADGGQNVRFRTEPSDPLPEISENSKPSDSTIESWTREFISNELKSIVRLGPTEDLVFLGTWFENVSTGAVDAKEPGPTLIRKVVGVFGRRIGGLDIIGAGSKVAVIMSVDSRVSGFDVDWPEYESTRTVETGAELGTMTAREQAIALRTLGRSTGSMVRSRFECGLHDAGARVSVRTPEIHLACIARYSASSDDGKATAAWVSVIPAAKAIPANAWWPEAAILSGVGWQEDPSYAPDND